VRDGRRQRQERHGFPDAWVLQVGDERLTEERRRRDDNLRAAEPGEGEITQAPAHRCADQQRPREDGDGHGDASDDERVEAAIVPQACANEIHVSSLPRAMRHRCSKRFASASLWVTTSRIVC
jgi:hypothetical protein